MIEARLENPANYSSWYGPCRYISARLITKKRFALTHGRVEARMQIPSSQGIWPALWMLGQDIDRELMTDSGCDAWFASAGWEHGSVYTRSPGEEPC